MFRRRFTIFVLVAAVFIVSLLFSRSSQRTVSGESERSNNIVQVPSSIPQEADVDETSGIHESDERPYERVRWYTDPGWLHSFSTSDPAEIRAALPPVSTRTPVYTYYDSSSSKDRKVASADKELLKTWRQAWWARGFEPIVLTKAEAMQHPLAKTIHTREASLELRTELLRWLAWGQMGTGLLSRWDCVPMTDPENPLLGRLVQGRFEGLTRFEGIDTGLFAGEKAHIDTALEEVLKMSGAVSSHDVSSLLPANLLRNEEGSSIACYSPEVVAAKYIKLSSLMTKDVAKGKMELNRLMKLHLQTVWQNSFTDGINVLKPLPAHTSKLIEPAQRLAQLLTECPEAYLQSSCPPNRPRCSPCVGSKMSVRIVESFRNKSSIFAISTIPHPLTMVSLKHLKTDVNVSHIRRDAERDPWIRAATRSFLGDGRNGIDRVAPLKGILASKLLSKRGLWLTVESFPADFIAPPVKAKTPTVEAHPEEIKMIPLPGKWLEDLDWQFGFTVPRSIVSHGESYSPVPGLGIEIKGMPEDRKSSYDPPAPTYEEAQTEIKILDLYRTMIDSEHPEAKNLRTIAEAWNMADSEIWRFARALRARDTMERDQWEDAIAVGARL